MVISSRKAVASDRWLYLLVLKKREKLWIWWECKIIILFVPTFGVLYTKEVDIGGCHGAVHG